VHSIAPWLTCRPSPTCQSLCLNCIGSQCIGAGLGGRSRKVGASTERHGCGDGGGKGRGEANVFSEADGYGGSEEGRPPILNLRLMILFRFILFSSFV
jgi:hypothetical protein